MAAEAEVAAEEGVAVQVAEEVAVMVQESLVMGGGD